MADDKVCSINVRLLPIKSHYFLFYGAMAGVIPFMPVLAKGLGISATAVGLVYTMLPFCIFFSKPIFGFITDYFQNIRLIVFSLVAVTSVAYFSVLFIPTLKNPIWTEVQVECATDERWLSVVPQKYDRPCLQESLRQAMTCELNYHLCGSNSSVTLLGKAVIDDATNDSNSLLSNQYESNYSIVVKFEPDTNHTCDCIAENSPLFRCANPDVNSCFPTKSQSVYTSYRFWLFTLLAVISGTGAATVFCLSDAACYEVLGDHPEHFGRQRLWGTINSGSATLLAGLLNDFTTGNSEDKNYSCGFYMMVVLVIIDLILLLNIKLTKANFSASICKNIGKIFSSCETVVFAMAVYIIGGLTGLILNYELWYLQDLGATQSLMGLTVAVQCLAAEVPFFFFSGWFIKKLGYFYCVTGSFIALSLRLGLYYTLQNPWMVLPIEVLHGVTYAVFYASMTGYASNNAPPGTEATMMGILGGLFEGLGVATGSLLGGVAFDRLGGRNTFLIGSAISLICAPTFALSHIIIKRLLPKSEETKICKKEVTYDGASSNKPLTKQAILI